MLTTDGECIDTLHGRSHRQRFGNAFPLLVGRRQRRATPGRQGWCGRCQGPAAGSWTRRDPGRGSPGPLPTRDVAPCESPARHIRRTRKRPGVRSHASPHFLPVCVGGITHPQAVISLGGRPFGIRGTWPSPPTVNDALVRATSSPTGAPNRTLSPDRAVWDVAKIRVRREFQDESRMMAETHSAQLTFPHRSADTG